MSCEGNRHQFFQWAGQKYGLDEKELEKTYQAAKARGSQDDAEKIVQAHKTRALFGVMRSLGITPPTHSASGLPKTNSCSGYAEIADLLSARVQAEAQEIPALKDESARYLTDGEGYYLKNGLHKESGRNRQGYNAYGKDEKDQHIWYGDSYANAVFPNPNYAGGFNHHFGVSEIEGVDTNHRNNFLAAAQNGLYPDGYDRFGFNADGYNDQGLDHYGFSSNLQTDYQTAAKERVEVDLSRAGLKNPKRYEIDLEGFAENGFMPRYEDELEDKDRLGYTMKGFKQGRSWTGYDEEGLDKQGNARSKVPWHDAWGYSRKTGLTEPDQKGRQYNLLGWEYDPQTDHCFNPENPDQKLKHADSWRYSGKYKKAIMVRSYVPQEQELASRLANPRIRLAEVKAGSDLHRFASLRASHYNSYLDGRSVTAPHATLTARYLRSEIRAQKNPDAAYLGVRLRCSKCGQYTGARAHQCPNFGDQEVIQFNNGIIAAWKPKVGLHGRGLDLHKDLGRDTVSLPLQADEVRAGDGFIGNQTNLGSWIRPETDASLVVLETPFREGFDPEFQGGPMPGYSYKTGLDQEGLDLRGFNPLTGLNEKGDDLPSTIAIAVADQVLKNQMDDRGRDPGSVVLVETYSRIASAMAGAPRRVVLEEKGGPRDGMFSTNMKGRINAERYPLGKDAFAAENLLAMKAGVYHELGHEEDTDPAIWARVLKIAKGEEEVEGLPKGQAEMVAEVFNIIEDGRMERLQAQRRRGIASILATDAKINPRWDETVGEGIPLTHQVTGMMLYRSLPFFRVRQEVFEQASPRARKLFDEIAPLVDRGTSGSGEDGLFAAVEVSRLLAQDEEYKKEQKQQQQQSQSGQGQPQSGGTGQGQPQSSGSGSGGGHFIISSATPRLSGQEVSDAKLPAPGEWRRAKEDEQNADSGAGMKKAEDEKKGKVGRPKTKDDAQAGAGRPEKKPEDADQKKATKEKKADDGQAGKERSGKKPEEKQNDQGKAGESGDGIGGGEGLKVTEVAPEPDADFFFGISTHTNTSEVLGTTAQEITSGISRRKSAGANKLAAKKLREPLKNLGEMMDVQRSDGRVSSIYTAIDRSRIHLGKADLAQLEALDKQSKETGKRFAQRLERLRASIRQRARHKTHGKIDRRRFKRAVAGSRSVYQQTQDKDITSLAVGVSVDMSGSMAEEIRSGKLFGSVSTISAAMDKLGADYMVSAFGSSTVLLKTIGDQEYSLKERGKLSAMSLGGTQGAPSMVVNTVGLSQSQAANKLQFVLSDGQFNDAEDMQAEVAKARQQGILPFGVYLGQSNPRVNHSFDRIYGQGNWVAIEHLDDLPKVAAGRIERIYRRLLATR